MNRAAVFFDRDNTLIVCDGYLGDPARVTPVTGAAEAVARVRRLGFATVVYSNQSGVARGLYGEDDVVAVNRRLDELLFADDPKAVIDRHEFCPFHPDGTVEAYKRESELRKPRPGMLLKAAEALKLDLSKSWAVGDAPRDVEAGKAAGCRTILIKDPSIKASPAAEAKNNVSPDFTVSSLREAADVIERESKKMLQANDTPDHPVAVKPAPVAEKKADPPPEKKPAKAETHHERVEELLQDILDELRRREDVRTEFSIAKLMAGIVQVIALAVFFLAYLRRDMPTLEPTLLTAIAFETLTIALLIMERQR